MDGQPLGLVERRSRVEAAREALVGISQVLYQCSGAELAEVMGEVDSLVALSAAARVAVTAEAVGRGEVEAAGVNATAWVRDHAPSLRQGGAADVAAIAGVLAPTGARWGGGDAAGPDVDSPEGIVADAVVSGVVSPGLGCAGLREMTRLGPFLREEVKPTVVRSMLELGVAWGPGMLRRLRPRLLAEYGAPGVFDDLQERLASAARLSAPFVESGDLTEYQLVMTPEQAAALEAAIGPLSAPAPNDVTGERDLRPLGQRRVEALAQVCQRSSALDGDQHGGADGAAGSAHAVHVIMSLEDLQARTGCGEVLGSTATGTMLSPQVLRRLACEADLIPHVLGTAGEDLDLGRVVRLFTRAQRRRLLRRDRGCTYPGCTAPAAWAKAHHVVHWVDGGLSDIDNAALLCQRHHTLVHQRRHVAHVLPAPDEHGRYVVWDLTPGSYDRHLEHLRAERSANDPPPLTPERLRSLVLALQDDDPDEQRWARYELHESWPDDPWPDDLELEHWWTPAVASDDTATNGIPTNRAQPV
ncbi:MAG TPA: HNH endonuclease [Ornithinibacter sp.]|jgi:hypothetical protein|nr:HNH endonuclease [Dermatophilaceae bacterium]HQV83067.1 HNH endonuclease [Ornithinibacter sp.]HQX87300.1 HNH endonuclease [Ornithinibacter sp.]HQZ10716.1 HNH endonuclease [Ornithinibacter sp.]